MTQLTQARSGMRPYLLSISVVVGLCLLWQPLSAQDWPQWRGSKRDAKATAFQAPKTWPEKLTEKWRTEVGRGDASPALVGERLYVFARQGDDEVTLCLNATDGQAVWKDKYASEPAKEPMGRHPGPRSSPTVAEGKVVTYGARGTLSCLEADSGKVVWRKEDFEGSWPRFFTSSSPMVTDGLCIAQLGGEDKGGIVAYELTSGEQKWRWTGDGTAYASPVLQTVDGTRIVVALTANKVVGVAAADGKLLWEASFAAGRRAYNAATPIVEGPKVIYGGAGRGTKAVKIKSQDDGFEVEELWSNPSSAVQFNTPVLKGEHIYGLSQRGDIFCLDAGSGKTLWSESLGGRGFGSIVAAGSVLMALTPEGQLVIFEPSAEGYRKLKSYQVASNETYAYPVPATSGVYIKDQDSLIYYSVE